MLRVVGGAFSGRRMVVPDHPGFRPTTERVREALFSLIGARLSGARVLELFAGSGILALEAVSRGALAAWAVEAHPETARRMAANLERCGLTGQVHVVCASAVDAALYRRWQCGADLPNGGVPPFNVVLMDPPYREVQAATVALRLLVDHGLLAGEALVVVEHGWAFPPCRPAGFRPLALRRYGGTGVALWGYQEAVSDLSPAAE